MEVHAPTTPENEQGLVDDSTSVFYFPADEKDSPEFLFFEERIIHGSGWKRASEKGRRLWHGLKEKYEHLSCEAFAGDRFVRRIHSFRKITVLLNQPIETSVVRTKLRKMMKDRSYHHLRWMFVDLILLPFSVFLWIIPGPNIIGYYLLFRVISHFLSFRSASRAEMNDVDVQVSHRAHEVSVLMKKAKNVRSGLHELRKKYGLRALQEHQFIPQSTVLREQWNKFKNRFGHTQSETHR